MDHKTITAERGRRAADLRAAAMAALEQDPLAAGLVLDLDSDTCVAAGPKAAILMLLTGAEAQAAAPADLEALKALALAATPGPWVHRFDPGNPAGVQHGVKLEGEHGCWVADFLDNADRSTEGGGAGERNAAFVAAASPAVVIALIDRIARAEAPKRPMSPEIKAAIENAHKTGATSAVAATGEAVFINYGHDLGDNAHLECTACGGSGHIEDQRSISAATKPSPLNADDLLRYALQPAGYMGPVIDGGWVRFDDVQSLLATKPAALEALRVGQQAVPEGWQLVPNKETPEWRANLTERGYSHKSIFRDVLAAAPASALLQEKAALASEQPLWDENGEPWNEAAEKVERERAHVMPPTRGTDSQQGAGIVVLSKEEIDSLAEGYDLYSIQDGGRINRGDFLSLIRDVEKMVASRCRAQGGDTKPDIAELGSSGAPSAEDVRDAEGA